MKPGGASYSPEALEKMRNSGRGGGVPKKGGAAGKTGAPKAKTGKRGARQERTREGKSRGGGEPEQEQPSGCGRDEG